MDTPPVGEGWGKQPSQMGHQNQEQEEGAWSSECQGEMKSGLLTWTGNWEMS